MTFNFKDLVPDFATKAEQLLDNLQEQGYTFQPTCGLRTCEEQAKLWRQSRIKAVIMVEIQKLKDQGCDYLANVINSVGPQYGPDVTDCIPGLSAHNWGEAMDVVYIAPQSSLGDPYQIYADAAVKLGLTAGYYFKSFPDQDHVQLCSQEISERYTLQQINDEMQKRFG